MIPLGLGERAVVLCIGGYLLTKFLGWQIALLIGVAAAIVQLWIWKQQASYWIRLGVPGPPNRIGWDVTAQLMKEGAHKCDSKWLSEYGGVYGSFFFGHQELCVADRDILKNILIKDFWNFTNRRDFRDLIPVENYLFTRMLPGLKDEEWKNVRNVVSPAFTSGKMKAMLPIVQDSVDTFCDILGSYADQGKAVDVKTVVGNFTADVIAAVAFGIKDDNQRHPNNLYMRKVRELASMFDSLKAILIALFPNITSLLMKLFNIDLLLGDLQPFFFKHLKAVVDERRRSNEIVRPDFLQLMLNAADGEEVFVESQTAGESSQVTKSKTSLNEFDMLSQSFLFLFAGHESTASAFTFVMYLLAVNPEVQDLLYEEIESVIGTETCTFERLQMLPYMEAVIQEALRVYPPSVRFDRTCLSDYQLTEKITIPRGTAVVVPVYAIHHNPEIYENPSKFDPARFINDDKYTSSLEYFPFGAGPRGCVGMRFAQMELKLTLANVFRKFRVETGAETPIPLEVRTETSFLRPAKPIKLYFKRRNLR